PTPASFPNSAARRLNSTSEAGTKLTHSRTLSRVPFGKLGAFCAATMAGIPPATAAPVAAPATILRNARRLPTCELSWCAMASSWPQRQPVRRWRDESIGRYSCQEGGHRIAPMSHPVSTSRRATALPGRVRGSGVWGAMSGPPTSADEPSFVAVGARHGFAGARPGVGGCGGPCRGPPRRPMSERLRVQQGGDGGPVLLLLHGLGATGDVWR